MGGVLLEDAVEGVRFSSGLVYDSGPRRGQSLNSEPETPKP